MGAWPSGRYDVIGGSVPLLHRIDRQVVFCGSVDYRAFRRESGLVTWALKHPVLFMVINLAAEMGAFP